MDSCQPRPIRLYRACLLYIGNVAEAGPHRGRRQTDMPVGARMADIDQLTRIIEPEAQALGFDLVRVKMIGGNSDPTLQVMAERPDTRQLTIDDCSALSHRISDRLDELEA